MGELPREENITEYVTENVNGMIAQGMINAQPSITYDTPSNTAFCIVRMYLYRRTNDSEIRSQRE